MVNPAIDGLPVGWFAPTYKMMLDVWRDTLDIVHPIVERVSSQERRIELITGGVMEMWSLDNPDAGRGRKYARAIIDEAALIKELIRAWTAAIRPTLTDYAGDAWFLSTPKGHNGFWQLYQLGMDEHEPDWMSWQMPTTTNPYIDSAEVEAARRMLPERVFAQEYLATFLEDGGGVFRRVVDAATAIEQEQAEPGHQYIMGVDLARKMDFTVITVIDISKHPHSLVFMDRFNQVDWSIQVGRIKAVAHHFRVEQVIVDQTGVGDPIVQQLQRELSF